MLRLDPGARKALDALSLGLMRQLGLRETGDVNLLRVEVLSAIGDVLSGAPKLKGLGSALLGRLGERMARSVTVFPVVGLDLSGVNEGRPFRLGDRIAMGALNDATEGAVSDFAKEFVGSALPFPRDAWWTEDLHGFREDPRSYEDDAPLRHVAVIAVGLDVVGSAAAIRGKELVEALLGALWLLARSEGEMEFLPPWVLGGPNRTDSPRDPDFDHDPGLPMVAIQVDKRSRGPEALPIDAWYRTVDVAAVLDGDIGLIELIAKAESPVPEQALARRLAAACRFGWVSGQDTSDDLQVLHLVVALEALVSEHTAGGGVTGRFITRLLALQDETRRDSTKLEALYNLRSEVGHQGFSAESRTKLAKATGYATDLLGDCVLGVVEAVNLHKFRDDTKLLAWLDRSSPDRSDPFA
ncbi:hypothetical protein [Pimelobacter simplex]|uniref:hypothetical protein n=1 Tax=Nocardioides simplex TaxID=2045 RepID=UPI00214F7325|nr:hypothetical protein [Pimelobacter simplex]UUW88650.1 hypothetical protein M0M43_23340 [Pimelobacter simplex]UUW98155.1 hypothetical protein M0M48_11990 [Pimelobacter simplex]